MYQKHAKKDFKDTITVFPEDLVNHKKSKTDRQIRLVSDSDGSDASDDTIDSDKMKFNAEKRLRRLMMQSSEDPFQQDMIEELPDDALRVYNNPDNFVKDAEN